MVLCIDDDDDDDVFIQLPGLPNRGLLCGYKNGLIYSYCQPKWYNLFNVQGSVAGVTSGSLASGFVY